MKRHPSRLLPVALAAALVFAACGGDDDVADEPIDSVADDGLRAPTPIQVVGGGNAGNDSGALVESGASSSDMMIAPVPWVSEYVVGDGMPSLPTDDTGWVFDASTEVTVERVQQLATALGVEGEPVRFDEGFGVSWRVGPDDGSAPTLWVSGDAQLSWNYSSAWGEGRVVETCAVAVDSDGNEIGDCPEPEPPVGVPSADEAERRARELLTAAGVDVATLEFETFADEWFASVSATDTVDPRGGVRNWNVGFGEEGVLQYAGGVLATPERVGPYPLVDLDTAIARLNDGSYWFGGGPAVDGPAIAVAEAPPAETGVDMMEGDVTGGAVGETETVVAESEPDDVATEPVIEEPIEEPVEPMPVESLPDAPMPGETIPGEAPESVVVTLVDVQADLWWAWDVDGAAWLLPAYRFIDADGGWHTVPAVTDEFLIQVEQPLPEPLPLPAPEPMPVEPDDGIGDGAEPLPIVDPDELGALVGLPLDDFAGKAEALGYEVRVVERDGVGLDRTDDLRQNRVNVAVVTVDGVEQVVRVTTDDGIVLGEITIEPVVDVPEPVVEPPGAAGPEVLLELADALPQPLDEFSERAASFGYSVRVAVVDGEPQALTADFSETRINVAVEGDTVVAIDGIG